MGKFILAGAASALALAIAACGSGDEGAENAQNQTAAGENVNAAIADASNPFAQSEMQMNERMMAAVGADVGDNWARKMIEHHQGAIDMSEILLEQNPRAEVADLARMTIEKQRKGIEDIRKLLKDGGQDRRSAELYRPAMTDMHQKMMAARGADVSETFMRKMVEHHKGAVAMSDVALQNGVGGALRRQVQKTRDENRKDAAMVEAMLRGETMQHAMDTSGAKPAQQAKADPAPAEKAKVSVAAKAPRAEPKPAPASAPAAAPTAEPKAPAPTCLPEHRAAGHC